MHAQSCSSASNRRIWLASLFALILLLAGCRSEAGRAEQTPAERETASATAPAVPAIEPLAAEPAVPAPDPAPEGQAAVVDAAPAPVADVTPVITQAYRELTTRLFREVRPAELLSPGWQGVRDEARRQGLTTAREAVQPFSDLGTSDIDAFIREFRFFLSGPGVGLDANKLAQAAIRGMTGAVGDSHTRYLAPCQSVDRDGSGAYSGIGVVTATAETNGGLLINQVYAGSPAEQAGLRAGDRIVRVNGAEVSGRLQAEISCQIRGETGTNVTLTIAGQSGDLRDVVVSRGRVTPPATPVISSRLLEDGIGYLRVAHFPRRSATVDAAGEFEAALQRLQAEGARGFILDLRGNPGGDPTASVDIASNFTQDGPIFVAVSRNGRRTIYQPNRNRLLVKAPLAVLTDGASASGAEVVASALSEYGAGYLIGGRTCGCLSVGQTLRLEDKSEIIVTVQQAFTGRYERSLEGTGLEPDELVRGSRNAPADPVLDRAVEYVQGKLG